MTTSNPDHLIPAGKGYTPTDYAALHAPDTQRIYIGDHRLTLGMPCGGIGAGQLYVRGDGTLGCWQIDGREYFTGVGHNCYRTYRPDQPIRQGFALATQTPDGTAALATLDDHGYDAIEFVGEYPRAIVRYRSAAGDAPPVDIDLEAFSPFTPLDARNSAWPATVLRFTLRNTSSHPLHITLAGWLENALLDDRAADASIRRRNRVLTDDDLTSVFLDVDANTDQLDEPLTEALDYGNLTLALIGPGGASPAIAAPLDSIAPDLPAERETTAGLDHALLGSIRHQSTLAPNESRTVTFLLTWFMPNLHTNNGRMYTNWFADSRDVARQLASQLDELRTRTVHFCDTYYRDTTLPWWLKTRLMMPVGNLATGTAQWWQNGRFWAWEGVCCCSGTCTHVWNYAQAHAWLFPALARSVREMQDLGEGLDSTSGLVGFRSDRNFAADGQAGTILKCYREHLTSADDAFLRKHWRRIRLALDYLIGHDEDRDGVIDNDRQHNTYDINFVGANTFVGGLYLAALRAGEEMACRVNDLAAARRYRSIYERGRAWTVENLFNGEYFIQRTPPGNCDPWQYGEGCLSDQLFGQTWAHVLGLGHIYPPDKVRSALAAVFRYNWAPDVGPYNDRYPPERWFATAGDAGLMLCTWPRENRPLQPVRYRDEVWSGIEYQVAAGLMWEGFVDEALAVVRGIDERYDGARHNPWNEVECGDHYARALASWSVLHAIAGFTFDGPAGRLAIRPRMQADRFAGFFTAGTGWGLLHQHRDATGAQQNAIELRWGTLRLSEINTDVPEGIAVQRVQLTVIDHDGETHALTGELDRKCAACTIRLAEASILREGQTLCIELSAS